MASLSFNYEQCGEPILMEKYSRSFTICFCMLEAWHDGPCKDDKGRLFKPAVRVEKPEPRKKKPAKK